MAFFENFARAARNAAGDNTRGRDDNVPDLWSLMSSMETSFPAQLDSMREGFESMFFDGVDRLQQHQQGRTRPQHDRPPQGRQGNRNHQHQQRHQHQQASSSASQTEKVDFTVYGGCPFDTWSVRDLKKFLQGVAGAADCIEKRELVALCRQKVNWPLPESTDNEAIACSICADRELDAVLIPCGHQMCSVCSYALETCPMCRASVERRIRTYR